MLLIIRLRFISYFNITQLKKLKELTFDAFFLNITTKMHVSNEKYPIINLKKLNDADKKTIINLVDGNCKLAFLDK